MSTIRTWIASAAGGLYLGAIVGLVLGLFIFKWDRQRDLSAERAKAVAECASGASRESLIGYVTACKARGGTPRAMEWDDPPKMKCVLVIEVKP